MLAHGLVLKHDELYLVGDAKTDGSGEQASGLYLRDTRHLSRFEVLLNGAPLSTLCVRTLTPATALIVGANQALDGDGPGEDGEVVPPMTISAEQHVTLDSALRVRFVLHNFSGRRCPVNLAVALDADFRDLFDIRGFPRTSQGGSLQPPTFNGDQIRFAYIDPAGNTLATVVDVASSSPDTVMGATASATTTDRDAVSLPPGIESTTRPEDQTGSAGASVVFPMVLESGERCELNLTIIPESPKIPAARFPGGSEREERPAQVVTDNPRFNQVLARAALDLEMLQTSFPDGDLPAAGVPWFVAPFGRDSLIVGLQTVHLAPARAAQTLRTLAALQGSTEDPFREEQPGKILHEMRYGEMARLGEIPHTPYYGSLDATPLFVRLFAETMAWTGDDQLFADLLPNVERALDWIERYGDIDGDGLVEYHAGADEGSRIVHQVWKDSHDSLHHRDGRSVRGVITPVEVQGYVYAAYELLASLVQARGHAEWAAKLRARAERVRAAVETLFWMEDEGYYAQALDGDKRQVQAISSNAGHLLYCGLPSLERAKAVAERMRRPDLDSGWGIRTLSTAMPGYNPLSYHNGSIWPHDNSLIAAGLRRYGFVEDANRIASALVAVAETDPLQRLPELYCGFARSDAAAQIAPVPYPVSCSPQAWAAASSQLLVRSMLGLAPGDQGQGAVVDPALPAWLNEVAIHGLTVRGLPAAVTVRRNGDAYDVLATGAIQRSEDVVPRG